MSVRGLLPTLLFALRRCFSSALAVFWRLVRPPIAKASRSPRCAPKSACSSVSTPSRRSGPAGRATDAKSAARWTTESRAALVADIKQQLKTEMGLLPVSMLRERRDELRRDVFLRLDRREQLRHGRVSRPRLLHHREARRGRAGRRRPESRRITSIKMMYNGRGPGGADRRHRRRAGRSRSRRLGDPEGQGSDRPAGARRRTWTTASTSPIRSSVSATTTRRASSSRPATSASGRRTTS